MQTLTFVTLVLAGQASTYVLRERGPIWRSHPARIMLCATAADLAIVTWNCRHDADAPVKLAQDALEGILYVRDSVVRSVSAARAKDGGEPRIEVTVSAYEAGPPRSE